MAAMKNSDKDDIFKNFKNLDDPTVEEISQKVPFLDSNAKERIARECERKIHMKDNKTNNQENDDNQDKKTIVDKVEVYHSKWYRSAIAAAACFVLIIGVAAGGAVIKSNRNIDKPYITQTQPTKQSVIISQTSSPSTKENSVIVTKAVNTTQTALTSVPQTTDAPAANTTQQPLQTTQQSSHETTSTASQSPYIDEDIIRDLIKENDNCRIIYNIGNLSYSSDNPIIKDGMTYYEITNPEYSSFSELEDYIRSVYTSDATEKILFNKPYENCQKYLDVDGKLCLDARYMGGRGYYTKWENCTIEIISTEGNSCTFKATGKYCEPAEFPTPEDYPITQTIIYENGSWKLQEIFS